MTPMLSDNSIILFKNNEICELFMACIDQRQGKEISGAQKDYGPCSELT